MDVAEFEQWFRDHFGKTVTEVRDDLEDAKARVLTLENQVAAFARSHADMATAAEGLADAIDPAMAPEVAAAVAAVKTAAAGARKLVSGVLGKV